MEVNSENLLAFVATNFEKYQFSCTVLNGIFGSFIKSKGRSVNRWEKSETIPKINDLCQFGLALYHENYFKEHMKRIADLMIDLIRRERKGETINSMMIKDALKIYCAIDDFYGNDLCPKGFLKENFEIPYLEEAKQFYTFEGTEFLQNHTPKEYFKRCSIRMKEEERRLHACLLRVDPDTLFKTCKDIMIEPHLIFFHSEFEVSFIVMFIHCLYSF